MSHVLDRHATSIESSSLDQNHAVEQGVPAVNNGLRKSQCCYEVTARHIMKSIPSSNSIDSSRHSLHNGAVINGEENRAESTSRPPRQESSALFLAAEKEENLRLMKYRRNRGKSRQVSSATTEILPGKRPTTETTSEATRDCCRISSKFTEKAFVKDSWSAVAFADVRSTNLGAQDDLKVFSELLDAQVSALQRLDELTGAWCREEHRVKLLHASEIDQGIIPRLISRDREQTSTLIQVLFERCVAIILKLSQEAVRQTVKFPKRGDIMFEPIALLSNAQFLLALLKSSHRNREIAAINCNDEISDFLIFESFYHRLGEHRVAAIAGQLVKDAVSLAMHAQNQAYCGTK